METKNNQNDAKINKFDLMVTREEFAQYVNVQRTGLFNMFDPRARELTNLDREQWVYIMENYTYLEDLYKNE